MGDTLAKRIGELLVEAAVLSQSQLEQALFAQRKDGRKLGHLLIELGLVSEVQLTQTLSRQLSVPWVSLYHVDFSRSLLNLVAREVAEKYSLVPIFVRRIRKQGETLYVAMDDPTNEVAIEEVARAASLPVKPMIACPSDIRAAIRVYYQGERASAPAPAPSPPQAPRSMSASGAGAGPAEPSPAASTAAPSTAGPSTTAASTAGASTATPPTASPPSSDSPRARPERVPLEAVEAPAPRDRDATPDSADAAPHIEATESEIVAPKRVRPRMISLTLLDGTHIQIPAPVKSAAKTEAESGPRGQATEMSDQLTARDLVSALRAVAHGVDASEILGTQPRWEAMFSALLSILLRKGIIADWEFIEEFRKI